MKNDYQNINSFDVAVVSMITIGFIIIGIILFGTLTPRQQTNISSALEIFDIHEQVVNETETVQFVFNIPNEFYKEFYVAFVEVASVPLENFELPVMIAKEMSRNVVAIFNNLSDQVAAGYANQNNYQTHSSELAQLNYEGRVMGAAIELSDKISHITAIEQKSNSSLDLNFEYAPPKLDINNLNLNLLNFSAGSMR